MLSFEGEQFMGADAILHKLVVSDRSRGRRDGEWRLTTIAGPALPAGAAQGVDVRLSADDGVPAARDPSLCEWHLGDR